MEKLLIILITIFFCSSSVVWCDINYYKKNFTTITSHPQLSSKLNLAIINTETANDAAIRNILVNIAKGKLAKDDSELIELIKNSIIEESMQIHNDKYNPKASIKAAANKAQILVKNITSAYTQAILKDKPPKEAHEILHRFQLTIQSIIDFTKNTRFIHDN